MFIVQHSGCQLEVLSYMAKFVPLRLILAHVCMILSQHVSIANKQVICIIQPLNLCHLPQNT